MAGRTGPERFAQKERVYEPVRDSVDDVELTSIPFYDESGARRGEWDRNAPPPTRSPPMKIVFKPADLLPFFSSQYGERKNICTSRV